MHLPGLHRFIAVVEAGSLNKAAERLHISQPALTKSIQALEERLGVDLFVRQARGVRLTSYGKTVFHRARLIDAEMRNIESDVEALRDLSMGSVNVGAPPGPGFHISILPAAALRLIGEGRKLSVNFTMGTRDQLLPVLRDGGLDFIVGAIGHDESTGDLTQEPLFEDRNCVVVRAGHPLTQAGEAGMAALARFPWLVMSESASFEQALRARAVAQSARPDQSRVRSDSTQLVKAMLRASDGIGLMRLDACRPDIHSGELHELRLDASAGHAATVGRHVMGVIYRREAELSAASLQLIAEIRAESERHASPAAGGLSPSRTRPGPA